MAEAEEQGSPGWTAPRRRHAELVDEVEQGLSDALKEYRLVAEEVLIRHLVELEQVEHAQDLELCKLRAENSRLREALGSKNGAESALFQTVMFQQMEEPEAAVPMDRNASSKWGSKRHQAAGFGLTSKEEKESDKVLNSRMMKAGKQDQQQVGSWQQFVAWVPNSAALMAPQPWKPLPPEAWVFPGGGKGGGAGVRSTELAMLPGMVHEEETHEVIKPRKQKSNTDSESTDSESDPEDREPYEVAEAWRATTRHLERLRQNGAGDEGKSRGSGSELSSNAGSDADEDYEQPKVQWFIIHPSSWKRIMWDLASLLMVVYDMVMIPLTAFDPPENLVMDWCTRLFWTFDMGWSMITAVILEDGKVNFRLKFIVKRYLKTWFALDTLIVSSDWMEVLMSSTNVLALGSLARTFRIARIVRLLRLVRMQEVMQAVTERIQSDKLAFILSTGKLLIFVLASSHVIACLWWAVGRANDGPATWIEVRGQGSSGLGEQYLVSLHWALCQFTGGMDEIVAINPLERFYAVCAWVFAFTATAVILSILTSNLTHLHIIGGAQAKHMATLRKYLKQNHISSSLALQVQRSAQHAVTGDLVAEDVQLLGVVAEPLRVEIHFEIYSAVLRNHPFFSDYYHEDKQVLRRICHTAMTMRFLDKGDVVFSKGEVPRDPKMYFVARGLLEYVCRHENVTVGERQWVGEPAVWTKWTHRGTFMAITEVKLARLDVQTFKDLVQRFKGKNGFDPRLYAHDFVEHLNNMSRVDDLTFLS